VRAGSIIPQVEENTLSLHIFCPHGAADGAGLLFSDAGDGITGNWLDQFKLKIYYEDGYQFTWSTQVEFPFPYEAAKLKLHCFEGKGKIQVHLTAPELENLIEMDTN
jgi:hypothetical protein